MAKLSVVLEQIDSGTILLPEFQRGYVWNRDQIRGLMRSLYLGYPVGALLIWETQADPGVVRGPGQGTGGVKRLLLDGQQRVTSLYGVMRGRPPDSFEGDPGMFTGLRFHVEDETFGFYAPAKMRDDPRWVDLTSLYVDGLEIHIGRLNDHPDSAAKIVPYMTRLTRVHALLDRDFHEEKITGGDKSVDVVVDIFNRVNSEGTKLSKGDFALAKICADWPEARSTMRTMRTMLQGWETSGYQFSLDWLLRNTNAIATGRAPFSALSEITSNGFESALATAGHHIGTFLDAAQGRLGLDHDRVLMGRYAIPVISRYLQVHGHKGHFPDSTQRDRALFWYIHAALWGRFAGSTETVLAQDYETVERGGIDALIADLDRWRGGNLHIEPHDFEGFGRGSRLYPLLYLMTRVGAAQDFGSGLPLKKEMLGPLSSLQVHHLFPKALLYARGYARGEVNAVANLCFLTQKTNLEVGKRPPEEYFREVAARHPDALASQWIPTDPSLCTIDRYRDFLEARRELLAEAANAFLTRLRSGHADAAVEALVRLAPPPDSPDDPDNHAPDVTHLVEQLTADGCARPLFDTEIADPETGRQLAIAEAYWPDGLQPGLGDPVVLELDGEDADIERLAELGFDVFTTTQALLGYVERRNRRMAGDTEANACG
jgi:hypothetical protein